MGGASAPTREGAPLGVRALRLHDVTGPLLLSLDAGSWRVLRGALDEGVEAALPNAFTADRTGAMATVERVTAWERLFAHGLAVSVPAAGVGSSVDLVPAVVSGLALFDQPGVRARIGVVHGSTAVTQVVAWDGSRAVGLTRRRKLSDEVDDPVVELALLPSEALLDHLLRAVPAAPPRERHWPGAPVTVRCPRSVELVRALRDGRPDVARHLADLPEQGLVALGAAAHRLTGAVDVTVLGTEHRTAPYRSAWLWTAEEVVRLAETTPETVGLQLSGRRVLRAELLGALTALAREQAGRTVDLE